MRTQKRIPRCNSTFSSASVMQCKVIQNILDNGTCWRVRSSDFVSPLSVVFVSSELVKIVVLFNQVWYLVPKIFGRGHHILASTFERLHQTESHKGIDQSWSDMFSRAKMSLNFMWQDIIAVVLVACRLLHTMQALWPWVISRENSLNPLEPCALGGRVKQLDFHHHSA